jgi:hypothetical protein
MRHVTEPDEPPRTHFHYGGPGLSGAEPPPGYWAASGRQRPTAPAPRNTKAGVLVVLALLALLLIGTAISFWYAQEHTGNSITVPIPS